MTLAKTKPKRPSSAHKKRAAQHHRQGHGYVKTYWPYLPMVAIIVGGLLLNTFLAQAQRNVLGYATDMSTSSLLSGTNNQRTANGLGSLALNSLLSQAAQTKANDMVTRDYWSHNTPDGQTPWTFIVATGYSYQTAGENLAYGFSTAPDTITGWMNSPGHRANILNTTFTEVGFGVANGPNYQGSGAQTVVVAMYALPVGAAPATPVTPTPTPAPTPAPTPTPNTTTATTPAAAKPATPAADNSPTPAAANSTEAAQQSAGGTSAETPQASLPKNATAQGDSPVRATQADTVQPKEVSRLQVMTAANVAWSEFAVSMLAAVALLAFLLRHSLAWHKVLVRGERFIVHHPMLDILFIAIATLGFILLQAAGTIR